MKLKRHKILFCIKTFGLFSGIRFWIKDELLCRRIEKSVNAAKELEK